MSDRAGLPPLDEAAAKAGGSGAPAPPTAPTADGEPGTETARLVQRVVAEFSEAARHLRVLLNVRADRASLRVRRALEGAAREIAMWAAAAVFAVCGIVLFAAGLAETLTALFEPRPWLGKLVAGVLLLSGAGAWIASHWAKRERGLLERHRRKYEHLEGSRGGGAVPGAGGDAGATAGRGGGEGAARPAPEPAQRPG